MLRQSRAVHKGPTSCLDGKAETRFPFLRNYKLRCKMLMSQTPLSESAPGLKIKAGALCQCELDPAGKSGMFCSYFKSKVSGKQDFSVTK